MEEAFKVVIADIRFFCQSVKVAGVAPGRLLIAAAAGEHSRPHSVAWGRAHRPSTCAVCLQRKSAAGTCCIPTEICAALADVLRQLGGARASVKAAAAPGGGAALMKANSVNHPTPSAAAPAPRPLPSASRPPVPGTVYGTPALPPPPPPPAAASPLASPSSSYKDSYLSSSPPSSSFSSALSPRGGGDGLDLTPSEDDDEEMQRLKRDLAACKLLELVLCRADVLLQ
jgi:hypothetical protein